MMVHNKKASCSLRIIKLILLCILLPICLSIVTIFAGCASSGGYGDGGGLGNSVVQVGVYDTCSGSSGNGGSGSSGDSTLGDK